MMMNTLHPRRIASLLILLGGMALVLAACQGDPELIGTDMEAAEAAPFELTDHRGETVQLADLEGRAVAMTFIFTNCPDVCPLIVQRMRMAYEELPEDTRDDVAFVLVTVDPERDSPEVMAEYIADRGVRDDGNWYGLTGDVETLEEVWAAYHVTPGDRFPADPEVAAAIDQNEHDHEEFIEEGSEEGSGAHAGDGHSVEEDENTAYWLAHSDVIYVLDDENKLRALLRSDNSPEDLADNLRVLAP